MNGKKQTTSAGKLKIIMGSLSLIVVFSTPSLNITQFSLSMNLFESAMYSLILLGFWVVAARLLRSKQTTPTASTIRKETRKNHIHRQSITTV